MSKSSRHGPLEGHSPLELRILSQQMGRQKDRERLKPRNNNLCCYGNAVLSQKPRSHKFKRGSIKDLFSLLESRMPARVLGLQSDRS